MKKDRYGMGVRVPCLKINVLQIRHSNMVASEKECRQKGMKEEEGKEKRVKLQLFGWKECR